VNRVSTRSENGNQLDAQLSRGAEYNNVICHSEAE